MEQLKEQLAQQYKLLLFEDLASITDSPTAVYKLLAPIKKQVFEPNERIVFYTAHETGHDLDQHIQQCLEDLDIPEFFLKIIKVEHSKKLGTGFFVPKTVCPLLWMHLEIKHSGTVYPCCVSNDAVGSAKEQTLTHVMHSESMQNLRNQFLQGQQPSGCSHCWNLESQGQQSNRQWHLKHYRKDFYLKYFDDIKIRSLDIKPGNVCNFKCRICNPTNSSLFADETFKKTQIQIKGNSGRWEEYNQYTWQQLDKILPNIENLDFYGGEPFLIKEVGHLLKSAVSKNLNQNIRVHFNSNGSVFPQNLIPLLQQFKKVDVALSIDNIGTRFELERGGSWPEIEQNILAFQALNCSQFNSYVMPTINVQNVYYLEELYGWAEQHNIRIVLNFLNDPVWANIDRMTNRAKQLVIDRYQDSTRPELQAIAQRIADSPGSNGQDFCKNMKRFDSLRKQNFGVSHPEIARAMGYDLHLV